MILVPLAQEFLEEVHLQQDKSFRVNFFTAVRDPT